MVVLGVLGELVLGVLVLGVLPVLRLLPLPRLLPLKRAKLGGAVACWVYPTRVTGEGTTGNKGPRPVGVWPPAAAISCREAPGPRVPKGVHHRDEGGRCLQGAPSNTMPHVPVVRTRLAGEGVEDQYLGPQAGLAGPAFTVQTQVRHRPSWPPRPESPISSIFDGRFWLAAVPGNASVFPLHTPNNVRCFSHFFNLDENDTGLSSSNDPACPTPNPWSRLKSDSLCPPQTPASQVPGGIWTPNGALGTRSRSTIKNRYIN